MAAVGDVLSYQYLWKRETEGGEESGRKARPVCVALTGVSDPTRLYLFPITSQRPLADRTAVFVPEIERRRANLEVPCWVMIDELNVATQDSLYDLEDPTPVGSFSSVFVETIKAAIKAHRAAGRSITQIVR